MRNLDFSRDLRTRARREAPANGAGQVPRGARRRRGAGGVAGDHCRRRRGRSRSGRRTRTSLHGRRAGRVSPISPEARDLKRFFFNYSHDTELDSANRVMIPPMLIDYAGLDKDVVVTGSGECLEVFDRGHYAGYSDDVLTRVPRHRSEAWPHSLT